jgi:PST family polysaccharide transporter
MKLKKIYQFNISISIVNQLFTAVIPLILLPWLSLKLGSEQMGVYALVVSMVSFFSIFIDYGFNTYSVNFILKNILNINLIYSHFVSVLFVRFINLFIAFLIICVLSFFFEVISNHFLSFVFGFLYLLGNILGPIWLYQSFSKLGLYSISNILLRLLFLVPNYFFVNSSEDLNLSIILWSSPSLVFGLISLFYTKTFFFNNITLKKINFEIIENFQNPFLLFVSNLYVSAYTSATTLISGFLLSPTEVSNFFIAERVIRGSSLLLSPISQVVFVKSHELLQKGVSFYRRHVFNLFKYSLLVFLLSLLIFIFSNFAINLLFKNKYTHAIELIKIMSLIPFFVAISNILGTQILLVQSRFKEFSNKIGAISILNLFFFIFFTSTYKLHGAAFACLLGEFLIILNLIKSLKYL